MLRRALTSAAVLGLVTSAAPVKADWHTFWVGVERDRVRNNCWPEPFISTDRVAARAPLDMMVAKGWQRQNLLSEHHFDKDRQVLSQAGQLKLHWILTQAPVEQRTVYVERAYTEEDTAARMDVVQQAATKLVPKGTLPQVVVSSMMARGWPADYVDNINRKYGETTPPPRLPAYQSVRGN